MLSFGLKGSGFAPSCRKTFSFELKKKNGDCIGWNRRFGQKKLDKSAFRMMYSIACLKVKAREEERGGERYSKRKDDKEVAEDRKCTQI
jgi:hypothetical protein